MGPAQEVIAVEWQMVAVLLIVAAAGVYLARATWHSLRASKSGCAGGCGCKTKSSDAAADEPQLASMDELTARLRQLNHS